MFCIFLLTQIHSCPFQEAPKFHIFFLLPISLSLKFHFYLFSLKFLAFKSIFHFHHHFEIAKSLYILLSFLFEYKIFFLNDLKLSNLNYFKLVRVFFYIWSLYYMIRLDLPFVLISSNPKSVNLLPTG